MAWFNPPELQACCFEDIGTTLRDTSTAAAMPRRIWELRNRISRCPAFALLLRAGARPLFRGPSAAVRRGRPGRAAGEPTDGLAFSTGQEPGRKARPRLTDFSPTEGRKASPRGGLSFGYFSLAMQRKVARAPTGARNRFVAGESPHARAPLPQPLSRKLERGMQAPRWREENKHQKWMIASSNATAW